MLNSLALIFLVGLSFSFICKKIKLPSLIGMLVTGIILGPFVLNFLDSKILNISGELRKIALIIILVKAGLSLNTKDLKTAGKGALFLSFVPASFEIIAYFLFAPYLIGINRVEALLLGSVLAAVSPAVVVPRMINMIENKIGNKKAIPQMILAGSSLDDIFVIVLFTSFLAMGEGKNADFKSLFNVPTSIVLGLLLGAFFGYLLYRIFESFYKRNSTIRNSTKVILILSISFLFTSIEKVLENKIAISSFLAVISMAFLLKILLDEKVTHRLSQKFGKLWIASEVILFVLVGASVDIRYTLNSSYKTILLIFIALFFRSIGVYLSLIPTKTNRKEKLFCIFSYLPKATVQAAIGSVPLSLGLPCGKVVLSVAVLGILITAPLGAFLMDLTYKKLVSVD